MERSRIGRIPSIHGAYEMGTECAVSSEGRASTKKSATERCRNRLDGGAVLLTLDTLQMDFHACCLKRLMVVAFAALGGPPRLS